MMHEDDHGWMMKMKVILNDDGMQKNVCTQKVLRYYYRSHLDIQVPLPSFARKSFVYVSSYSWKLLHKEVLRHFLPSEPFTWQNLLHREVFARRSLNRKEMNGNEMKRSDLINQKSRTWGKGEEMRGNQKNERKWKEHKRWEKIERNWKETRNWEKQNKGKEWKGSERNLGNLTETTCLDIRHVRSPQRVPARTSLPP